jgi:hypothetical protein
MFQGFGSGMVVVQSSATREREGKENESEMNECLASYNPFLSTKPLLPLLLLTINS